ncbi:MAG: (2Fe-2S)-binding protein [Candidatus Bipolaricaulis sp.]|nr:(2Fe-2S)-binding protein [Candidatus Bipolaricaulis sp.]MDD5218987.1 (2Fe-2S)-binding protein [Candidatus Bipolaricaulis sp.]
MASVELTINSVRRTLDAAPGETLLEVLRREGYTGVKRGCGSGDCGACTVLLDGRAVNACLVLAAKANGKEILTIEGLASGDALHPIQEAFLDEGAVQCGYCTPGMILSAYDLLSRNPTPSEGEIRQAISGNLCRCTGYVKQVRAIQAAAERMRSARHE